MVSYRKIYNKLTHFLLKTKWTGKLGSSPAIDLTSIIHETIVAKLIELNSFNLTF